MPYLLYNIFSAAEHYPADFWYRNASHSNQANSKGYVKMFNRISVFNAFAVKRIMDRQLHHFLRKFFAFLTNPVFLKFQLQKFIIANIKAQPPATLRALPVRDRSLCGKDTGYRIEALRYDDKKYLSY